MEAKAAALRPRSPSRRVRRRPMEAKARLCRREAGVELATATMEAKGRLCRPPKHGSALAKATNGGVKAGALPTAEAGVVAWTRPMEAAEETMQVTSGATQGPLREAAEDGGKARPPSAVASECHVQTCTRGRANPRIVGRQVCSVTVHLRHGAATARAAAATPELALERVLEKLRHQVERRKDQRVRTTHVGGPRARRRVRTRS